MSNAHLSGQWIALESIDLHDEPCAFDKREVICQLFLKIPGIVGS